MGLTGKKDETCAKSSGIDQAKFEKCKSDRSLVKQIQDKINKAGSNVKQFPKVFINGKDHSMAQSPFQMKLALCREGVKAACGWDEVVV